MISSFYESALSLRGIGFWTDPVFLFFNLMWLKTNYRWLRLFFLPEKVHQHNQENTEDVQNNDSLPQRSERNHNLSLSKSSDKERLKLVKMSKMESSEF